MEKCFGWLSTGWMLLVFFFFIMILIMNQAAALLDAPLYTTPHPPRHATPRHATPHTSPVASSGVAVVRFTTFHVENLVCLTLKQS